MINEATALSWENVEGFIKNPPEYSVALEILANSNSSLEALQRVARSNLKLGLRAAVVRNVYITEDIVQLFALEFSSNTDSSIGDTEHNWLLDAFGRFGSPPYAISSPFQVDADALVSFGEVSSFLLEYGQQIATDLWSDLASHGMLQLIYEMPEGGIYRLGPFRSEHFDELATDKPARSVFCKHVEPDSWLDLEAEDSSFPTDYDEDTYEGDFYATVMPEPPMVTSPRYQDLQPYLQRRFASLLSRAQEHYMIKAFRAAEHIGKLMVMHPDTHSSAKDILLSSEIPNLVSNN